MMTHTKTIVAFDQSEKACNHGVFGIACNENRNLVYVNNLRTPSLLVVDGATGEYLRNVDYGKGRTGFGLVAWSPVADRLYAVVTNHSRLYVFDGPTERLVRRVKLDQGPRGVVVDSKSGRVFVAHYGEGWFGGAKKVTAFDADGKKVGAARVDFNPWEMCVHDGTLYVSCKGQEFARPGTLCAVDMDSMKVTGRVQVGRRPRGVAVKGRKAYVASRYDSVAHVVDTREMEVIGRVGVDCDPIGVYAHPRRDLVYVLNRQGVMRLGDPYRGEPATISVIDPRKDAVIHRITAQKTNHYGAINSRTGIMYVGAEDSNDVAAVDTATNKVLRTTLMGRILDKIELLPGTGQVYAGSHISDELVVVDANAGKLKKAVKVGGWPWVVAFDPQAKRAYVDELDRGTITVYDTERHRAVDSIDIGTRGQFRDGTPIVEHHQYLFSHMAIDARRHRLYVSCPAIDSLAVVDTRRNRHLRTVDLGWQDKGDKIRLWEVAVNEANGHVYLHNPYMGQVTVVDPATLKVADKLDVPKIPYRQLAVLKADPLRDLLYVGPSIVDLAGRRVKGALPKKVGTVVEHIDVKARRLYVSRFVEDPVAYQKVDALTVADADTYEVLDRVRLTRPSGQNLAVDPKLGMVVSKPLVKGVPFYAEVDVYRTR